MKLISLGSTNPASILSTSVIAIFLFSIFSTNALAQTCVAPSPNIVAWWPFDETSGTASQDFSGINDGVHVGGPVPTPGIVGGSLRFDGINDYVAVPDSDHWNFGSNEFTIEFWANFDVRGGGSTGHPGDVFISNDEGPGTVNKWFLALGSGALNFHVNGRSTGSTFSPRAPFSPIVGRWYHLAITRTGTSYSIFVDSVLSRTGTNSANIANANAILTIGRALEPFGGFMNGRLDEMTIYNRALTESELRAVFNAGSEGKCKGVTIDTQALSAIQLNTASSQQLQAISGVPPYSWSVAGGTLPPGMNLSESGVFNGTPTELSSSTFTVQVTDDNGDTDQQEFTVDIVLVLPPPDIRINKTSTIAVPGRVVDYFIVLENKGNTVTEGFLSEMLITPDVFDLVSTSPDSLFDTPLFVVWDVRNLEPDKSRVFQYSVKISPDVLIGEAITGPATFDIFDIIDPIGDFINGRTKRKLKERLDQIKDAAKRFSCTNQGNIDFAIDSCKDAIDKCIPSNFNLPCTLSLTACRIDLGKALKDCRRDDENGNGTPDLCDIVDSVFFQGMMGVNKCSKTSGPIDPNEKLVAANKFIQPDQTLVYPIHFENIGEVEAIDVFITDLLDPTLDDSTLQILTPNGTYDSITRTLKWNLLGRNLLPGETDNVLLSIKPVPGLPSGTEIRNSAEIMFEIFDPLVTPEVVNIIDTTLPECSMDALPNQVMTTDFDISWSGTDAVGEIDTYSIFVSDNATDYTLFLETSDTSATFTGVVGTTYNFFCIAKDTAGNVEVESLFSEATTTVDTNQPPTANAGIDQTVECTSTIGSNVTLDGSGSSDPDGDNLTYIWTGPFGTVNGQTPTVSLPLGAHTITLLVDDGNGGTDSDTIDVTVENGDVCSTETISIDIDIKPRSHRNRINPKSRGKIKVAILTTDNFDAAVVDPSSVKFGPDEAPTRKRVKTKDVNKDGLDDLVLRFRTRKTGIACNDTGASLTGKTFDGQAFTGSDFIKTVGCKKKKRHGRGGYEDKDNSHDSEGADDEHEEED